MEKFIKYLLYEIEDIDAKIDYFSEKRDFALEYEDFSTADDLEYVLMELENERENLVDMLVTARDI